MTEFTLIKNADIYSPEHKGCNDILLSGNNIALIDKHIDIIGLPMKVIDIEGRITTPGFIDQHVHLIGGGGRRGYSSLVEEVKKDELVSCGTTTAVGMLGTDGIVKELTSLYAKAKALDDEGLTAYMLTNYYGLPAKTLTGDIASDMILIDKVIGCKIAISDDRCSFPDEKDLLRLINKVRLGGFTSHKGGILHIHVGALKEGISSLIHIARQYPTLIPHISPTHLIRTEQLFNQALEFALLGGMIDFSTGGTRFKSPYLCVMDAIEKGISINNITFSSDGHGGVLKNNDIDTDMSYKPAPLNLNLKEMSLLVQDAQLPLEEALKLITVNPAHNLNLNHKGRIEVGYDADLCVLNSKLCITDVFAKGVMIMQEQKMV
jgi:beta-aspartyl-dipeptidase (metallo-type)